MIMNELKGGGQIASTLVLILPDNLKIWLLAYFFFIMIQNNHIYLTLYIE